MTKFSAEWLALREPADTRARSTRVTQAAVARLSLSRAIRVLDLGAGSGANVRYLASKLPADQQWLLADQDEQLLAEAVARSPIRVETRAVDLSMLDGHRDLLTGRDLITASALLDLVSERWLTELCALAAAARSTLLFALSYDGRITFTPPEPADRLIVELVNRHQRTDKGFGQALGPDATMVACRLLVDAGYEVVRDRSDWVLTSDDEALQRELIEGWAEAACEIAPRDRQTIDAWRARRLEHVAAGRSHVVVGHEDLASFPRR